MKNLPLLLMVCLATTALFAQRKDDIHLTSRIHEMPDYPVFTAQDIAQLNKQSATLEALIVRIAADEETVKELTKTLNNDVLPTIHVFDFLKWIIGLMIVALVGVVVNDWWTRRPRHPKAE